MKVLFQIPEIKLNAFQTQENVKKNAKVEDLLQHVLPVPSFVISPNPPVMFLVGFAEVNACCKPTKNITVGGW